MWRRIKVEKLERALVFENGTYERVLAPGVTWLWDPWRKLRVLKVDVRNPWLRLPELDVIAKSDKRPADLLVVDLNDDERALVWIDGRFDAVLEPGLYALWTSFRDVDVELIDVRQTRLVRSDLAVILKAAGSDRLLERVSVDAGWVGLYFEDGALQATLGPGTYAFWRMVKRVQVLQVDTRESAFDVSGQEIMTADKVTLRLNAVVTYRVSDPQKAVASTEDYRQALYREAQLALRAVVGTRELDALLTEKDAVAAELEALVKRKGDALGVSVIALGIRDVILPGDMKELLNKVTEARKAAEAVLITRREETAAMRSQANTARLLEANPTLMRLRELEVLEKVADQANLTVVLGEGGLANRVVKLL